MKTREMAGSIVEKLTSRRLTVATAESCTGGMAGAYLTAVPGASAVFECGIIAYANRVKAKLLGVSEETLTRFGAVSRQTAEEMAKGVRRTAGSSVGISSQRRRHPEAATSNPPAGH